MPTIAQLERLLALDPSDAFVLYGLAQEHAKAGRHDQAVVYYDRCLASDPASCYAYYHKARSLQALGRNDDAADALRAGLEAARLANDAKARSEIGAYLDQLT